VVCDVTFQCWRVSSQHLHRFTFRFESDMGIMLQHLARDMARRNRIRRLGRERRVGLRMLVRLSVRLSVRLGEMRDRLVLKQVKAQLSVSLSFSETADIVKGVAGIYRYPLIGARLELLIPLKTPGSETTSRHWAGPANYGGMRMLCITPQSGALH
jgi:hypothetical protein